MPFDPLTYLEEEEVELEQPTTPEPIVIPPQTEVEPFDPLAYLEEEEVVEPVEEVAVEEAPPYEPWKEYDPITKYAPPPVDEEIAELEATMPGISTAPPVPFPEVTPSIEQPIAQPEPIASTLAVEPDYAETERLIAAGPEAGDVTTPFKALAVGTGDIAQANAYAADFLTRKRAENLKEEGFKGLKSGYKAAVRDRAGRIVEPEKKDFGGKAEIPDNRLKSIGTKLDNMISEDWKKEVHEVAGRDISMKNFEKDPLAFMNTVFTLAANTAPLIAEQAVLSKFGNIAMPGFGMVTGGAGMMAVETGNFLQQAEMMEQGLNDKQKKEWQNVVDKYAPLYGMSSGLVEYSGNAVGVLGAVKAIGKKLVAKQLLERVAGVVGEGLEELGQEALMNRFMGKAIEDMKAKDKNFAPDWKPGKLGDAFKVGLVVSLVHSGGVGLVQKIVEPKEAAPPPISLKPLPEEKKVFKDIKAQWPEMTEEEQDNALPAFTEDQKKELLDIGLSQQLDDVNAETMKDFKIQSLISGFNELTEKEQDEALEGLTEEQKAKLLDIGFDAQAEIDKRKEFDPEAYLAEEDEPEAPDLVKRAQEAITADIQEITGVDATDAVPKIERRQGPRTTLKDLESAYRKELPGFSDEQYKQMSAIHDRSDLTDVQGKASYNTGVEAIRANPREDYVLIEGSTDLDKFKLINDNKGHSYGNDYLVVAHNGLAEIADEGGIEYHHLSGDEGGMYAYVPKSEVSKVVDTVKKMRGFINNMQIKAPNNKLVKGGISIGISVEGFDKADELLGTAKTKLGRNSIYVDDIIKKDYNIDEDIGTDYSAEYEKNGFISTREKKDDTQPPDTGKTKEVEGIAPGERKTGDRTQRRTVGKVDQGKQEAKPTEVKKPAEPETKFGPAVTSALGQVATEQLDFDLDSIERRIEKGKEITREDLEGTTLYNIKNLPEFNAIVKRFEDSPAEAAAFIRKQMEPGEKEVKKKEPEKKPEGVVPQKATKEQQREVLDKAVVGTGEFNIGEVYTQEIGLEELPERPVLITKKNEDGSVEGYYVGSGSLTEIKVGIGPAALIPAKFEDPGKELNVPAYDQKTLKQYVQKVFKPEEAKAPEKKQIPVKEEKPTDEFAPAELMKERDKQATEIKEKTKAEKKKEEVKGHLKSALDKFKEINDIFGEAGALSGKEIDETTYSKIKPLLQEALNDILKAGKAAAEFVTLAIENLTPAARPYFERFVTKDMQKEVEVEPISIDDTKPLEGVQAEGVLPSPEAVRKEPEKVLRGPGEPSEGVQRGRKGPADEERPQPPTGEDDSRRDDVKRQGTDSAGEGLRGRGLAEGLVSDYQITPEDVKYYEEAGKWAKFDQNVKVINLLKRLQKEDRQATKEEQGILSKYVGWGQFPDAFNVDQWTDNKALKARRKRLQNLLTEEEYKAARGSTLNAHYTAPVIVEKMYDAIKQMGFDGGFVLDPAFGGTGMFTGVMPAQMKAKSNITGIELDPISAQIAKQLYPQSDIRQEGFEEAKLADNSYDLAISNVPFGAYSVYDKKYAKENYFIHDYFFAKSLDKVRPGGLVAFVTSAGTMNSTRSKNLREMLSKKANFLGAIRLPGDAFKRIAGTEVTTDIIFLQKLPEGGQPTHAGDWLISKDTGVNSPVSGKPLMINEYFVNNPEMMLGKVVDDKLHPGRAALKSTGDIEQGLKNAIRKLPKDVVTEAGRGVSNRVTPSETIFAPDDVKPGAFTIKDGVLYSNEDGKLVKSEKGGAAAKRIKGLIGIRDIERVLRKEELAGTDEGADKARKKLNTVYDKFVKSHGYINDRPNALAFNDDPDYNRLVALEVEYDASVRERGKLIKKASAKKADIFTQRVIPRHEEVESANSAKDALLHSLNEYGRVNINYMADIYDKTTEEVLDELQGIIYNNPDTGQWETKEDYLSGNVRQKLEQAEFAAKDNPSMYEENVRELKKIQPEDIAPTEISARMGANWIPKNYIKDFVSIITDAESQYIRVSYSDKLASWDVGMERWASTNYAKMNEVYGTQDRSALVLINDLLNFRTPTIRRKEGDASVVDKEATMAAREKQKKIKEEFGEWLWSDSERADKLVRTYNDQFNNTTFPTYDGSHLALPGIADYLEGKPFELRPHQKDAVWRIVKTGNTLLAHEVGAGKTFVMSAAVMELKRLGIAQKPLIVVPNHMMKQLPREFLSIYPNANLLVSTKTDLNKKNRNRFMSKIAMGNWDGVIVPMSSFGLLPMSKKSQADYIAREIDDLEIAIRQMKEEEGGGRDNKLIKQIEGMRKRMAEKYQALLDNPKDDTVTFEELGIDFMMVDEAHNFKNLFFATKQGRIAGVSNTASKRASDLFMKTRYLNKLRPGRNLVFSTGTPIDNTIAEMYTMQRYLQMESLEQTGLTHFDAWTSMFAEPVTGWELSPDGKRMREHTRMRSFVNLFQLNQMFREVADVKVQKDLNLKVPKQKTGGPQIVAAKASEHLKVYVDSIIARMENMPPDPREDNFLKATNDGRKAALDMRLIDPHLPDNPDSKINKAIENIFDIWKKTKADKSTQIVFCDLSTPSKERRKLKEELEERVKQAEAEGREPDVTQDEWLSLQSNFSVYDDVREKLIEMGVPEKEIAFIHDYNSDEKKASLFKKVNDGDIRVVMGSTAKMGEGTNMQERAYALHHLDAPWKPGSIKQRDGRIIRQGNTNEEVETFRYVTEQSFDAYLWQILENKALMIEQVLTDPTKQRVDDVSMVALSAAQAKAAASGNPLQMEKVKVDSDVSRLQAMKKYHDRDQFRYKREAKELPDRIAIKKKKVAGVEKDLKKRTDTLKGDKFKAIIDEIEYDKRSAADLAMEKIVKKRPGPQDALGNIGGFDFTMRFDKLDPTLFEFIVKGENDYPTGFTKTAAGGLSRMVNVVSGLEDQIKTEEKGISKLERELNTVKEQVGKPFDKEEELTKLVKRQEEVFKEIQNEGQEDTVEEILDEMGVTDVETKEPAVDDTDVGINVEDYNFDKKTYTTPQWEKKYYGKYKGNDFVTDGTLFYRDYWGLTEAFKESGEGTELTPENLEKAIPEPVDREAKPLKVYALDKKIDAVLFYDGEAYRSIDKKLYNTIRLQFPGATFKFGPEERSPISFYRDDVFEGVVMPILPNENTRAVIKNLESDKGTGGKQLYSMTESEARDKKPKTLPEETVTDIVKSMGSPEATRNQLLTEANAKEGEKFLTRWERIYQGAKDATVSIRKVQKIFEKELGVKVTPINDIEYAIDRVRGSGGTAKQFVADWLSPIFEEIRKSTKEVRLHRKAGQIGKISRNLEQYLIAKRQVWLYENKPKYDDVGYTQEWSQGVIDDVESGKTPDAALIQASANKIWNYSVKLKGIKKSFGIIDEEFEKMLREPYYVPFFRDVEKKVVPGIRGEKFTAMSKGIKRIKGSKSGRNIRNVFANLITITNETLVNAARNEVFNGIIKMSEESTEIGELIKKLPPRWKVAGTIEHRHEIDKFLSPELSKIIEELGAKEGVKIKMGKYTGSFSSENKEVMTMFGATESTKAHELGHLIDQDVIRLQDMVRKYPKEMVAVGSTRYEGGEATQSYIRYVHKNEELVAEFVSMYITDRTRLAELAPDAIRDFEGRIQKHKTLKKLIKLYPSRRKAIEKITEKNWILDTSIPSDEDVISGFVGGKMEHYRVPAELASAVKNLHPEQIPIALRVLTIPTSILRKGAVQFNVDFFIPNSLRDQIGATFTRKFYPVVDYLAGLKHYIAQDEVYKQYLRMGGAMDSPESGVVQLQRSAKELIYGSKRGEFFDPHYWKETGLMRKTLDITSYFAKAPFRAIAKLGEASEQATRLGVFERGLKSGENVMAAIHSGRQASLEFQRFGTHGRVPNQIVPFINVALEGVDRAIRSAYGNPKRFAMAAFTYGIAPTIALTIWNTTGDDEDEYKNVSDRDKENNYIIMRHDGTGRYWKIPKSHIVRMIANPFQLAWERSIGTSMGSWHDPASTVWRAASPIDGLGAIVPTGLKLLIEPIANYDFYWRQTIESHNMRAIGQPGLRAEKGTSETLKKIGKALNISPIMMQHEINTLFSGLGRHTLFAVDWALGKTGIQPETEITENRIPVLRRFLGKAEDWKGEASRAVRDINKAVSAIDRMSVKGLMKYNKYKPVEALKVYRENKAMKVKLLRRKIELLKATRITQDLYDEILAEIQKAQEKSAKAEDVVIKAMEE